MQNMLVNKTNGWRIEFDTRFVKREVGDKQPEYRNQAIYNFERNYKHVIYPFRNELCVSRKPKDRMNNSQKLETIKKKIKMNKNPYIVHETK